MDKIKSANTAIRKRCSDCSIHDCDDTNCILYKFLNSKKEKDPIYTIKRYCNWCMSGNSFSLCSEDNCAIKEFRKKYDI